jgi:hypothetical protein
VSVYKPGPLPEGLSVSDISIPQAMALTGLSVRTIRRLIEAGEWESFLLGGSRRRIVLASILRHRERCIAAGPQLGQRPTTGKRPVGRPRKAGSA